MYIYFNKAILISGSYQETQRIFKHENFLCMSKQTACKPKIDNIILQTGNQKKSIRMI